MRNVLAFIALCNSMVLMFCLSQADVNELVIQPRRICGNTLTIAMKTICRPEVLMKLKSKKSIDFGDSHKFEKAIDRMLALYDDEESQSDEGGYGYDWLPNYLYMSQFHKRDTPMTITAACCKNPCTLSTLSQYCPIKRN